MRGPEKKQDGARDPSDLRFKFPRGLHTMHRPFLTFLLFFSVLSVYNSGTNNVTFGKDSQETIKPGKIQLPKGKIDKLRTKAAAWLETFDVDPIKLRTEKKMKGKKFFVEYLHSYLHLYQLADSRAERKPYRDKVKRLFKFIEHPEYHNLNKISIEQFREDSISYLNACYLMGVFGYDNTAYKEKVSEILLRINSDMPNRGINQQMAFRYLLDKLGFSSNYEVRDLVPLSVIRAHKEALTTNEVYDITHEIFFLSEFGKIKINTLNPEDWIYLRKAVPIMMSQFIKADNIDLLGELVVCMKYLNFEAMKEYETGLNYILDNQNENGSLGRYEKEREKLKQTRSSYDVDIGGYLHTTEVCLWALSEALGKYSYRLRD